MHATAFHITDLKSSNPAMTKSKTKQNPHFDKLLLQQTEPFLALKDKGQAQQGQEQQPAEMYDNLKEVLPDEVVAILKENDALQEEIKALWMQEMSFRQKGFPEQDNEQQFLPENLFHRHISVEKTGEQIEIPFETETDGKMLASLYGRLADLLQGMETTADIADTAEASAKLLQEWEGYFQAHPDIDQAKVLDHIRQQIQSEDAQGLNQVTHQMVYQLLHADWDAANNSGELLERAVPEHLMQALHQVLSELHPQEAEQIMEQMMQRMINTGVFDENMQNNTGVQHAAQEADVRPFIDILSSRIRTAEPSVRAQAVKQIEQLILAFRSPEQDLAQTKQLEQSIALSQKSDAADVAGLQRLEAKITAFLQSALKEVAPGVIKRENPVHVPNQTGVSANQTTYRQPEKSDMAARTDRKLAAWLQTSFQGASSSAIGLKQDTLPISKVEQFIIHMGQTDGTNGVKGLSGKELIEKIETIVQTQRLQNFTRGQNPTSIQLRPENLGDMTIRFIQTNGELTVQMLVSSKAVKEVLESNLHQLRNMFSPHQVTIERQDHVTASQTDTPKNAKGNQNDQQQSEQQEASPDPDEQYQTPDAASFEAFMEQLLSQHIDE